MTIDFKKFQYSGNVLHVFGGVQFSSETFSLQADDLKIDFVPPKSRQPGGVPIQKATAEGNATSGTQVTGRFQDISQGRTFKVLSDHAVYVPDNSRPGGGKIDFTGHVALTLGLPVALAEPSVTHLEHAIVLLGKAPEYPKIEGESGHTVLTPLQ